MECCRAARASWSLVVTLAVAGCGSGGDGPGIVDAPTVLSVAITPPSRSTLDIGETVQLGVVVQVANGASQAVEWQSSANAVATVSSSGVVTAIAAGQTTITAVSVQDRSKSGTVTITVNPPNVVGVSIDIGLKTVRVGESFTATATVATRGTLPQTVTFSSGDPTVATVSSADGRIATITGVSAGQAVITAKSTADPTKTATLTLTVLGAVRITGATPLPVALRLGSQVKVVPTVQADPGVSTAVTFQSQSQTVATVSSDGTVTGVGLGSTSIVITAVADAQQRFTVPVTVRSGVTSVSLTPRVDSTRAGLTHQLTLNVVTEAGASGAVNFSSSSTTVATVDNSGKVTGIAPGQAYVRALAAIDPSVGDSTLVVVVDPCKFAGAPALVIGGTVNSAITDVSCDKVTERFTYTVNTQTALMLTGNFSFPADFAFFVESTGLWVWETGTPGSLSPVALLAPGTYGAWVKAKTVAQRGTFSIAAATNGSLGGLCSLPTSIGVTATLPLNNCGFQPQGRPAGTYYSYEFTPLFPYLQAGERLTVTVTATGFVPLIEVHPTSGAAQQAIAAPGSSTVSLQFDGPPGGTFAPITVSSRDPGQTGTFVITIGGPLPRPPQ